MRSVIYSMGVSLDGYIVGPDGDITAPPPDEEVWRLAPADILGAGKLVVAQTAERVPLAIHAAAVIYMTLGLGFGIGTAITLDHLRRHGELPMTPWGFRSLAGGPFEQLSAEQFSALGLTLVGVCALDVVAGVWLWQGQRRGLALGIATTPLAFGLGVGFALPFLLAGVPMRVALALAGRRDLR